MVPNPGRHLQPEQIERYSMGYLPENETAQLEEHLLICGTCRNLVRESDELVRAMREAAAEIRSGRNGHTEGQSAFSWLPIAAAVGLAAVALLVCSRLSARDK